MNLYSRLGHLHWGERDLPTLALSAAQAADARRPLRFFRGGVIEWIARELTGDGNSELPGVTSAPVVIEDDVWISFGVTIMNGVRIGAGSVIAANSIVTKDVPPRTLYHCQVVPVMRPL